MRRAAAMFLVAGLGAAACGAQPTTVDAGAPAEEGPSAERATGDEVTDGSTGPSSTAVPSTTVAPSSTVVPSTTRPVSPTSPPPTTSPPAPTGSALVPLADSPECLALAGTLIGPESLIDEPDDAVVRDVLVEVLGPIDPRAADAFAELYELVEGGEVDPGSSDSLVELVGAVDDLTHAACGLPVLSASGVVDAGEVRRFCEVSTAIDEGFSPPTIVEDTCPPEEAVRADSLPCFRSTGASLSLSDPLPYEAVDCASGEAVEWDPYRAQWQPVTDNFVEVDQAIGGAGD